MGALVDAQTLEEFHSHGDNIIRAPLLHQGRAIISESPERPNQFVLQELWRGTRADFDAVQGVKPYRKAYLADVKQYLEMVEVEWNTPIAEWSSRLTDLNGA